jgi:hypothetical protein
VGSFRVADKKIWGEKWAEIKMEYFRVRKIIGSYILGSNADEGVVRIRLEVLL